GGRGCSRGGQVPLRVAEEADGQRLLDDLAVARLDAERPGAGAGADDAREVAPDEVQRGAVVGRVAGAHAVADEAPVLLAPLRLAVVVDAVRVWQQADSPHHRRRAVEGGDGLLEP